MNIVIQYYETTTNKKNDEDLNKSGISFIVSKMKKNLCSKKEED